MFVFYFPKKDSRGYPKWILSSSNTVTLFRFSHWISYKVVKCVLCFNMTVVSWSTIYLTLVWAFCCDIFASRPWKPWEIVESRYKHKHYIIFILLNLPTCVSLVVKKLYSIYCILKVWYLKLFFQKCQTFHLNNSKRWFFPKNLVIFFSLF